MDIADVHGTGGTLRNHHGGRHGVQDDGEERASRCDEAVPSFGGGHRDDMVVSPCGHGDAQQRQQLVRARFPFVHPQCHRLIHP